jgi:hypothetical protein
MGIEEAALSVFVSSTGEDLKEYREAAALEIRRSGWNPVMYEDWGALPDRITDTCRSRLEACQFVLLLMAFRQGWVPTPEQGGNGVDSMTALELSVARTMGKPVLAVLAEPKSWPGALYEEVQARRDWVTRFRGDLNLPAEFFDPESDRKLPNFRGKLARVLANHKERLLASRAEQVASPGVGAALEVARDGLRDGTCIPFLGLGIHGSNPLGRQALIAALADGASKGETSLATAAQYFQETHANLRSSLLRRLQSAIDEQTRLTPRCDVYDMLLGMKNRPKLVVSTTFDDLLEERLVAGKWPLVVVAHVGSSFKQQVDGQTVVLRAGVEPEVYPSDKVALDTVDEVILYKPLGSPALNRRLADAAGTRDKQIDTVTITESDHLTFLSRLRNQSTCFPTAFSRLLQTSSLLFLGYTLDVWQYRLVAEVFRIVGAQEGRIASQAVRQPLSDVERTSWKRLGADLIELAPDEFARRVTAGP